MQICPSLHAALQEAGTRIAYLVQVTAHEPLRLRGTMTLPGADSRWPNGGPMVLSQGASRKDVYALRDGPRISDAELQARTTLMCW